MSATRFLFSFAWLMAPMVVSIGCGSDDDGSSPGGSVGGSGGTGVGGAAGLGGGTGGTGGTGGGDTGGTGGGDTGGTGGGAGEGGVGGTGGGGGEDPHWLQVSAGGMHTCAVRSDNTLWCWGDNSTGQLGNEEGGAGVFADAPEQVVGLTDVVQVSAGWVHTCAVTAGGQATCWGANDLGQLGNNDLQYDAKNVPQQVHGLSGVSMISAGAAHTCALKNDGTAWCWGLNEGGMLGNGNSPIDSRIPVQVEGIVDGKQIHASAWHTCVVTTAKKAKCWGLNWDGELGVDPDAQDESDTPVEIGLEEVEQIASGDAHSCAIVSSGEVYCWGADNEGQLGNGSLGTDYNPRAVDGLQGAVSIDVREVHSAAVDDNGVVWAWGDNASGQLGDGTTGRAQSPVAVDGVVGAVEVATGDAHTCALVGTGVIYCWGANGKSQLTGNSDGMVPVLVSVP